MKKVFMFPGQGSQFIGMGKDLFESYPDLVEEADKILGYSIKELCLYDKHNSLNNTEYTQPALYTINCLSYLKEKEREGSADCVLGHSLGEYSALFAAGVYDFQTGLKLVKKRGELMNEYGQGCMVAVIGAPLEKINSLLKEKHLESIDIANINSYDQIVLSGLDEQISLVTKYLSDQNFSVIPLPVSGAFHSRYMQDAKIEYEQYLETIHFNSPNIPIISNVTASSYDEKNIKELLSQQITSTVNWLESIELLLNSYINNNVIFKEVGPKKVLTNLYNKINSQYQMNNKEKINPSDAVTKVELWNKKYNVGTKVYLRNLELYSETKSEAIILFGHRPVIYIYGYKGYFDLDDIALANNEY
ncbi:ACP S-malonyltransferase [Staphylococcus cohnii]